MKLPNLKSEYSCLKFFGDEFKIYHHTERELNRKSARMVHSGHISVYASGHTTVEKLQALYNDLKNAATNGNRGVKFYFNEITADRIVSMGGFTFNIVGNKSPHIDIYFGSQYH